MKTTIASNIFMGFGIVLLFICGVGFASYGSLTHLIDTAGWIANTHVVLHRYDKVVLNVLRAEAETRGFALTDERRYLSAVDAAEQSVREEMNQLRRATVDDAQRRQLDTLESLVEAKFTQLRAPMGRKLDGAAQANSIDTDTKQRDSIVAQVDALQGEQLALLTERNESIDSLAKKTRYLILYGGFITLAFTGLVGVLIKGGLKDVTGQARSAAQSLSSAVQQILTSTRQQTSGSSEQATAVLQANATMQEISRSGQQIAFHASEVSAMAEVASKASHAGLGAVQNTNSAMEAIREQAEAVADNAISLSAKTQTVGEIVASVNEIAQQSHLLALNAAIQAAAAGEHGLTFAVVASEIKSLADQSREATVQVRSILGDIQKSIDTSVMLTEEAVKRVELGKQHAEVAAGTIREMNDSIQQSMHAFQQIVAGTNEQQTAFQQVTQAFKAIGHASEQTAIGTRQLEGSATNLMTLGQELSQAMDRYQV